MKNKLLLAGILILAMAIVLRTGMVLGATGDRITQVCRTNGGVLVDKLNCPGGSLPIPIGEASGGGGQVGVGGVAFLDWIQNGTFYALMTNGQVKSLDKQTLIWGDASYLALPSSVQLSDVLQWKANWFVTKTGEIWYNGIFDGSDTGWQLTTIQ